MSTYPEQLRILLLGAGLTDVVTGYLPHTPDRVTMVRGSTGVSSLETHNGDRYERPRAQIICRAADYDTAWADGELAMKTMNQNNIVIDGVRYLSIRPTDTLSDLGKDDQKPGRHEVSFNVTVTKEAP